MNNYKALVSFYSSNIRLPIDNVMAGSKDKAKEEARAIVKSEGFQLDDIKAIKITRVK